MRELNLDSGNLYADAMLDRKMAEAPEYWALVDYLAEKGILDRNDFMEFLLCRLEEHVRIVTQVRGSCDD